MYVGKSKADETWYEMTYQQETQMPFTFKKKTFFFVNKISFETWPISYHGYYMGLTQKSKKRLDKLQTNL